jgi:hypothetical protein
VGKNRLEESEAFLGFYDQPWMAGPDICYGMLVSFTAKLLSGIHQSSIPSGNSFQGTA